MAIANDTCKVPIEEFSVLKQKQLFQDLKQSQFSGQLLLTAKEKTWSIYLYLGRIIYATGGVHAMRRWKRNLAAYLPQITSKDELQAREAINSNSGDLTASCASLCWEYQLLYLWLKQQQVTRQQTVEIVRAITIEVFFDLTQVGKLSYQLQPNPSISAPPTLIDAQQIIGEAWKHWTAWQAAKVADRSPNAAPVVRKPEELRLRSSTLTYQAMVQQLDGQRSLRDIAVKLKQDVVQFTRALMPYIQLGLVELVDIPDSSSWEEPKRRSRATASKGLVACITLHPDRLKKVLTKAGYRYICKSDLQQAIAILLARKPNLIVLDSDLPETDVYEIGAHLRKIERFHQTPLVFLTEQVNLVDRLRAKLMGHSTFLSKPLDEKTFLETIDNFLQQR